MGVRCSAGFWAGKVGEQDDEAETSECDFAKQGASCLGLELEFVTKPDRNSQRGIPGKGRKVRKVRGGCGD